MHLDHACKVSLINMPETEQTPLCSFASSQLALCVRLMHVLSSRYPMLLASECALNVHIAQTSCFLTIESACHRRSGLWFSWVKHCPAEHSHCDYATQSGGLETYSNPYHHAVREMERGTDELSIDHLAGLGNGEEDFPIFACLVPLLAAKVKLCKISRRAHVYLTCDPA
jgi:hypothetical protein